MSDRLSRKSVLVNLLGMPLAAAAVASAAAPAEAKSSPESVKYVQKSINGKFCKNCRFYLAAKAMSKPGTCTIVSGPIEPLGFCVAYAPR